MKFFGRFSRVKTIDADEARERVETRPMGTFTLVDVRQPNEYEGGHIPGAVLIPLPELESRLAEIDPGKPVFAY